MFMVWFVRLHLLGSWWGSLELNVCLVLRSGQLGGSLMRSFKVVRLVFGFRVRPVEIGVEKVVVFEGLRNLVSHEVRLLKFYFAFGVRCSGSRSRSAFKQMGVGLIQDLICDLSWTWHRQVQSSTTA